MFKLLDINDFEYHAQFDIAFSNAALHWVKDHDRLLDNVRRALVQDGRVRFNFAGDGNCSNFFSVVREVMISPRYRKYFEHQEWPWYMPKVEEYKALVNTKGFSSFRVWGENKDRYLTGNELVKWIDQPSIIPFLAMVDGPDKSSFRDSVVDAMKRKTRVADDRHFETFRRINLSAIK
jgi:trans-aconitate methyltransferase